MTLLQFLALWANPTNWVKIYSEEDFKTATALVATGIQWSEISIHLKSLLTFNPKYAADTFLAAFFLRNNLRVM